MRRQPSRFRRAAAVGVVPVVVLGQAVRPDKAGRLVTVPEDTLEPGRSFGAGWALWAAVLLIVLLVALGYLRRRWKAGAQARSTRRPAWDRYSGRK